MVVWVQILRALAALAVMVAHAHNAALNLGIGDYVPDFPIGAAGVDLFFVISGFVMVTASRDLFGAPRASIYFFLRRLARIAPIYWIATALWLYTDVYHMVGTNLTMAGISARNIVTSLLFIPDPQLSGAVYPVLSLGWTLNFEMFFYAMFAIALLFRARIAVPLLTVAMIGYGQLMWHVTLPMPFRYWSNPIIEEFAFGMLIGWARMEGYRIPIWLSALLAAGGLTWFASAPMTFSILPRQLWWGLPAVAMVAGAGLARHDLDRRLRAAAFMVLLGDSSYALYLFHPIAMFLPKHLLPIVPATAPHLYFALMMVSCVVTAIVIHLLIERPITRWLQQRIKAFIFSTAEPRVGRFLRFIIPAVAGAAVLAFISMPWPKCSADSLHVKIGAMLVGGCR